MPSDIIPGGEVRLDSYTKDEWKRIAKLCDPDFTEERYEQQWKEFVERKALMADVQGNA